MNRTTVAVAALLALLAIGWTVEPAGGLRRQKKGDKDLPMEVQGDTVVVVRKTPFKIRTKSAEDYGIAKDHTGGCDYTWTYPDIVRATAADHVLTVTAAPKGTFAVKVKVIAVNITKPMFQVDYGATTVNYGGAPGPDPDPDPKPPPDDPFVKTLRAAYQADAGAKKAEHLEALAALYRQSVKLDLGKIDTAGQLFTILSEARGKLIPADALVGVRKVIQAELTKALPLGTEDKLTQAHKDTALKLFATFAEALVEAGK